MRIYANKDSWADGFDADWYTELSLKPIFKNTIYRDIEDDIICANDDGDWKFYNGIEEIEGKLLNPKTGEILGEDDDIWIEKYNELDSEQYCKWHDSFLEIIQRNTYENGELINTEIIKI